MATPAHVLLVDDDKFLLGMYATKFAAHGFDVQACLSAGDALKVLRGGFAADAILFDIMMPEQDGFSFLQSLRDERLYPNALKVALTNHPDDAERSHALSLGAEACLVKASTIPSEVVNIVGDALAKKRAHS